VSNEVIRLSSVTYAIRAQKVLEQKGIRSYVKRVADQNNGCGYGLEIQGDVHTASRLISESGIRIVG